MFCKGHLQNCGNHPNLCHLEYCFSGVALGDMQDTKWQVNVVKVFEEDSQRLSRAPLIVSLLKIKAVDQESIFGFVLLYLFICFVLQVILEH